MQVIEIELEPLLICLNEAECPMNNSIVISVTKQPKMDHQTKLTRARTGIMVIAQRVRVLKRLVQQSSRPLRASTMIILIIIMGK